jgi:hypothetical protein
MLHFGIYYNEWNKKGLGRIQKDRMEKLRTQVPSKRLLPNAATQEEKCLPEGISSDDALLEGIMVVVKETKLQGK